MKKRFNVVKELVGLDNLYEALRCLREERETSLRKTPPARIHEVRVAYKEDCDTVIGLWREANNIEPT
jgi:hypothetical protein